MFIIIINIFTMLESCKQEPKETTTDYSLENITNHKFKLKIFYQLNIDSFILLSSQMKTFQGSTGEGGPVLDPFSGGDSLLLIYDDTISILHGGVKGKPRNEIGNLLNINTYEGGKVSDSQYQYRYKIKETDYEEALNFNK